jgi:sulfur-oxidizing protein SoxZ
MRIRARLKEGVTEVHVLMPHPMETGFRTDDAGRPISAHYITDVQISLEGRTVLAATLSRAVSQDPLLYFRIKGGRANDTLRVDWIDTRGERRSDAAQIEQGAHADNAASISSMSAGPR